MATDKDFYAYMSEQLFYADAYMRPMMGEYVVYAEGKVIGGLFDNRFLVKITPSSTELCDGAERISPYKGAKEMFLVENTDDPEFLRELCHRLAGDVPETKRRKKRDEIS